MLRAGREGVVLRPAGCERELRLPMSTTAPEDVWREMHAPLLRLIARRVSDTGDAEDVLQDVMVRIQRHAAQIGEFENLTAWVHQVTRSAVVDFYRRRAARPEQPAGTDVKVDQLEPETRPDAPRSELAACLSPLMRRLPDKYREALEITELEGISQVAAAEQLGLSTSGMKARVQRGRTQLRDLLLDCCEVELDRRGGVVEYHARSGACDRCGASPV